MNKTVNDSFLKSLPFFQHLTVIIGGTLLLLSILTIFTNSIALPFIILIGSVGGLFIIQYPKRMFFLMVVLRIVLDLGHSLPYKVGGLNLLALYSGLSIVLFTIFGVLIIKNDIEHNPLFHPFVWFVVILIFAAIRSYQPRFMIDEFLRLYGSPLVLLVGCSLLKQKGDAQKLLFFMMLAGIPCLLSGIYAYFDGQMSRLTLQNEKRLMGSYENLRLASLMSFFFAHIGLYWFINTKNKLKKSLCFLYFLIATLFLFLTKTRATMLIYIMSFSIFLWLTNRKTPVYFGFFCILTIILTNANIQDRFKDLYLIFVYVQDNNIDLDTMAKLGSGRYGLWSTSFEQFLEGSIAEVILGWGYGYHYVFTRANYGPFVNVQGGFVDVHNGVLRTLYQTGIVGMLLFHGMMLIVARYGFNLSKNAKTSLNRDLGALCVGITVGLLINQGMSNGINNRVTPGWCFWAIGAAVLIAHREQEDEDDDLTNDSQIPQRQPVVFPINKITRPQEKVNPFNLNS